MCWTAVYSNRQVLCGKKTFLRKKNDWHANDIRVHTSAIGWRTSTYEWHMNDIQVHASDIQLTCGSKEKQS